MNNFLIKEEHPEVIFAENFKANQGDFFYCESVEDFLADLKLFLKEKAIQEIFVENDFLQELLKYARIDFHTQPTPQVKLEAGLTLCEGLVARTGSILFSTRQTEQATSAFYSPIHIILAFSSQLVLHLDQAWPLILQKYGNHLPSVLSLVSGISPSPNPTYQVGGPREIVLFLVDDLSENTPDTDE